MLNGVSDVINLNRRRSGVQVNVNLSTALDAPHSPAAQLPPTQMPDTVVHRSLPGQRPPCVHDDAVTQ